MKRIVCILGVVLTLMLCVSVFSSCTKDEREEKYKEAVELLESRDYEAAYALFVELGDYHNAAIEASYFRYIPISHPVQIITAL